MKLFKNKYIKFKKYDILLIPDFEKFGGTRSYFISILNFYFTQNYTVLIVLSEFQLDVEIKNLITQYNFSFITTYNRTNKYTRFPCSLLAEATTFLPILFKYTISLIVISTSVPGTYFNLSLFCKNYLYILHTYPTHNLKHSYMGILANRFVGKHKRILTVSEYSKTCILNLWLDAKRKNYVEVIYNYVLKHEIYKNKSNSKFTILTAGHVTSYKNPILWIEIANKVIENNNTIDIEFVWAGSGDLLLECKQIIYQRNLRGIYFLDYQKDMKILYENCDIYFQPSSLESHGISVIEAMNHGKPCVVSDVGGLVESVIDGVTGFIEGLNNSDNIEKKISLLLTNKQLRERMGKQGKIQVETKFSHYIWKKKMINLHQNFLSTDSSE